MALKEPADQGKTSLPSLPILLQDFGWAFSLLLWNTSNLHSIGPPLFDEDKREFLPEIFQTSGPLGHGPFASFLWHHTIGPEEQVNLSIWRNRMSKNHLASLS